jgi:hypothetical protein
MSTSEWHYKRALIAEEYLKTMFSGVMLSTTVLAPPKTGLSHFFIHDLMPYATQQGYGVAYVHLSNPLVPVAASMLMALDRLCASESHAQGGLSFLKSIFQPSKKKAAKGVDYYHSTLPADAEYFVDDIDHQLHLISQKVEKAMQTGHLLLIFDDAHALARDAQALRFAEYLRGLLLEQRDQIFPIYGTSDLDTWRKTFQNKASPLHSEGACIHKLPLLDIHFLRAWIDRFAPHVDIHDAVHAFKQLGCCPGTFMELVDNWSAAHGTNLVEYTMRYSAQRQSAPTPSAVVAASAPC